MTTYTTRAIQVQNLDLTKPCLVDMADGKGMAEVIAGVVINGTDNVLVVVQRADELSTFKMERHMRLPMLIAEPKPKKGKSKGGDK